MAIDDNTIYGLTGAQVKELPGKINAVKGLVRELTSADYNANYRDWNDTDPANFNTIAAWLLEPGIYTFSPSVSQFNSHRYASYSTALPAFLIVGKTSSGDYLEYIEARYVSASYPTHLKRYYTNSDGTVYDARAILDSSFLYNGLDYTREGLAVLDAYQGKVLKDLIDSIAIRGAGAPTTATVGQVGTLYEDTTNGDLYICTDATNPYVWEEVGSGGGGSTTIQTTTDGTNYSDVLSLPLAGSNSLNFPYAYPIMSDGNVQEWGYIRPVIGPQSIISAYVGGYEYDGNEDLWSGKQEARLALYSDVHDATLTIQQNGTTVDTFSANASTNKTVNIETPATFTTNEWNALWA